VYATPQPPDHLGTGWAFPFKFSHKYLEKLERDDPQTLGQILNAQRSISVQGGIQLSSAERKVRESIWIILNTRLGERVYRPTFGSRLSELAFAPLNTTTLLLMRMYVQEALETWEPRIILDDVITDPDPNQGRVDIDIVYRLKDGPDQYNFVYPFYLDVAAGE
jgi:phage baseplate assembly protein W